MKNSPEKVFFYLTIILILGSIFLGNGICLWLMEKERLIIFLFFTQKTGGLILFTSKLFSVIIT